MSLLLDNPYSTVVDLEEDAFEIERYAVQRRELDSWSRAITYLELDKRHQLSND